ncbi:UDP-glucose 4-epimerase GalE [Microbulbifer elongatus]|uniref:UDP-glucose 4-epimerase GalE n=1 Tax=Microbulbifer elongatus TaxID=86173 RepID=UPI001E38678F|nr:UDP-glucose 4-epimerase GalE [Microbulbifer elongatus]
MKILVTGGAGYIGSHTCVELIEAGFEPVVVDNLCNSSEEALRRVEAITGHSVPFHHVDITDARALGEVFRAYPVQAVVHFAGLKAVGESVSLPLRYYQNNVAGTLTLCEVMEEAGVRQLIFSSSATVYGDPATVPIQEDFPTGATNPYGASKLMVEDILRDLCKAPGKQWKISLLRYFNPIGAHESGTIGEDPAGIPNNLLPYVAQVAVGRLPHLQVFGDDYATSDGTGVRDYIHVVDLARGHLAALNKLGRADTESGCYTYNLGTGRGSSVLEIVRAFAEAAGKDIPYQIVPRRPGDIAECYADPAYAEKELGWKAEFDLKRMVTDTWRWQSQNPNGYGK